MRLVAASIFCAVAIVWGIPIAGVYLGFDFDIVMWIVAPLMVVWLLYFGFRSLALACPGCGRSVFMRGNLLGVPWPARTCGACGTDLTVAS